MHRHVKTKQEDKTGHQNQINTNTQTRKSQILTLGALNLTILSLPHSHQRQQLTITFV